MGAFARPLNSWDIAKLIAILLMFVDHSGWFFFHDQHWLRAIGRGAAPIFLFLTGFASSYRFHRELFVLALMMTVSDILMTGTLRPQNILVNILLCRMLFAWLEKRGKKIEKPYEWYIGSLALFSSLVLVQYGTFGLMLAISGYLKRHRQYYSRALAQRYLQLTMVTYAGAMLLLFTLTPVDVIIMAAVLYGVYRLLWNLEVREVHAPRCPPWLLRLAKLLSYYSGYIYALHLMALEWITRIPF